MIIMNAKVLCVVVLSVCLSASADQQEDVIDQIFEQEIDIYNLGKLDENRDGRSLLPGDKGHHHDHDHNHNEDHQQNHDEHHEHADASEDHEHGHVSHEHDDEEHDAAHDEPHVGRFETELVIQEPSVPRLRQPSPRPQAPVQRTAFQRPPTAGLGVAAGPLQPQLGSSGAAAPVAAIQQPTARPQLPSADVGLAAGSGQQPRSGKKLLTDGLSSGNAVDVDQQRSYQFEYKVSDDKEQSYQKHIQNSNNQVVSGEYSWVDPFGTLHIIRYRADETGYHILDNIEKKNFVEIVPREQPKKKKVRKVRKFTRPRLADPRRPTVFKAAPATSGSISNTNGVITTTKQAAFVATAAPRIVEPESPRSASIRQQFASPAPLFRLSSTASTQLPSSAPKVKLSSTAFTAQLASPTPTVKLSSTASPTPTVRLSSTASTQLDSPAPTVQLSSTTAPQRISPASTVKLSATSQQVAADPLLKLQPAGAPSQQLPAAFVRLPQRPAPRPAVLLSAIQSSPPNTPRPFLLNRIKSGPLRRLRLRPSQRPQILSAIPLQSQRNGFNQQNSISSSQQESTNSVNNPVKIQTASVQVPIFNLQRGHPFSINSVSNGPAFTNPITFTRPVIVSQPNFINPVPSPLAVQVPVLNNQLPVNGIVSPVPAASPSSAPNHSAFNVDVSSSSDQVSSPVPFVPALPPLPLPNTIQTVSNADKEPFQAHPDPDLTRRIFGGSGKVRFNAPSHKYEYRA